MKKNYLLLALLFTCFWNTVSAEKGTIVLKGPQGYEIDCISPNGKWVCGHSAGFGYVWDLEQNIFTEFNKGSLQSSAKGVANDGTVCGLFYADNLNENGVPGTTGGYYKDGKIYPFTDKEGKIMKNCEGLAISADGRTIAGYVDINGRTQPCVWIDGQLDRYLPTEKNYVASVTGISDDGSIIIGWYDHYSEDIGNYNRQPCCWNPDLTPLVNRPNDVSGFTNTYAISPNKKYVLVKYVYKKGDPEFEQGYSLAFVVRNMETGEAKIVESAVKDDIFSNVTSTDVLDDGTAVVGLKSKKLTNGIINDYLSKLDGTTIKMSDYIQSNFNSTMPEGLPYVGLGRFSADGKVYAGTCITPDNTQYYPVIWVSDTEITTPNLTKVTITQSPSRMLAVLRWEKPLINSEAVTGYRIYDARNSENPSLLKEVPASQFQYIYDPRGTKATVKVCTIYGEGENIVESEGITMTATFVVPKYGETPTRLTAYQYNYNDIALRWSTPISGYASDLYLYKDNTFGQPFGSNGEKTFLAGVEFNKDLTAHYLQEKITGVKFYFNAPVEKMELVIYEGETIIHEQEINQNQLTPKSFNAVKLAGGKELTFPSDKNLKVALRITQTEAGAPLQFDEGPVVIGGDLLSDDGGATWNSIKTLSGGSFNGNWMIGLLFGPRSGMLPGQGLAAPILQHYNLYRDDVKLDTVITVTAEDTKTEFEYREKNLPIGYHDYTVVAYWSNGKESPAKYRLNVTPKKVERCPAPIDIKTSLSEDKTKLTVNWDMPEQAEATYTNWTPRVNETGVHQGPSMDLSNWIIAIELDENKIVPYAGFDIVNVNFYPVEDADFTIHIYEGKKEVATQEVDNYTLNQINTIRLKQPVTIKTGHNYLIAIEMYDAIPKTVIIPSDTSYRNPVSNLYSEDGGENYRRDNQNDGNYMIGIDVTKTVKGGNPGVTYNVYMDGEKATENLTEETCNLTISDTSVPSTTINVASVYSVGEKKSEDILVIINPVSIDTNKTIKINVYPNPASAFIAIEGGAEEAALINVSGEIIYRDNNVNTIDVTRFTPGIYLLQTTINGDKYTNKIQIIK